MADTEHLDRLQPEGSTALEEPPADAKPRESARGKRDGGGETRKTITGALFLFGQPLLLNILSIPATAYIIRQLGATGYGQWAVSTSVVAMTAFLGSLGLRPLFVREVAQRPERAQQALAVQLTLRGTLAAIGGLLAILICWLLRYPPIVFTCTVIGAAASVATVLGAVLNDLLCGYRRLKLLSVINMVSGLVLTGGAVVAAYFRTGPVGQTLAYTASPVINLVLLWGVVCVQYFPVILRWDLRESVRLLRESSVLAAFLVTATLRERGVQLFTSKVVGLASFGYLSAGMLPANRLGMLPDSFQTAYFPLISWAYHRDRRNAPKQVAEFALISLITTLPLATLIFMLADPIADILFPDEAAICRTIIRLSIWALPLLAIEKVIYSSMQAAGKHTESARLGMRATLISPIVNIILVLQFGIVGAAVGLLFRKVLAVLLLTTLFRRTFPTVIGRLPSARLLLSCGVTALALYLMLLIPLHEVAAVTLGTGLAMVAYGVSLLAMRVVGVSELKRLLVRRRAAGAE